MIDSYDFIVIGAGSAGYAAASTASRLGLKTAIVDGAEQLGGLCILRGCMPSKTLLESASRFRTLRRAREFGLRAEQIGFEPREILARKRRLVGEFADYRVEQLNSGRFDLIRGMAGFVDPHTIEVRKSEGGALRLHGKTFLIATGSRPTRVTVPGLEQVGYLGSDDVLEREEIPKSVVVLGGGATALEFASYYNALGSEVTVIQRSAQVLKEFDPDVAEAIVAAFQQHGTRVYIQTKLLKAETRQTPEGRRKVVHFEHEGEIREVEAEEIVYALGREPQLAGLNLQKAGEGLGVFKANNAQQTSVPHIFAAGDAVGPYEIVHIAIQQGELVARNVARLLKKEETQGEAGKSEDAPLEMIDHRLKLFGIFCEPEVAMVGKTEKELAVEGIEFEAAKYPFNDHGKSLVMGESEGFVKLIVDKATREILGGAVVGPHAVDLIHEIVVAMYFRATAGDLAQVPHYHPTLSEIWTYPAEELA
jgi:pyruvate/2-oxoglutarate dehydrogenase complex dihydrolipoamide dehydrogenase (E3) component